MLHSEPCVFRLIKTMDRRAVFSGFVIPREVSLLVRDIHLHLSNGAYAIYWWIATAAWMEIKAVVSIHLDWHHRDSRITFACNNDIMLLLFVVISHLVCVNTFYKTEQECNRPRLPSHWHAIYEESFLDMIVMLQYLILYVEVCGDFFHYEGRLT